MMQVYHNGVYIGYAARRNNNFADGYKIIQIHAATCTSVPSRVIQALGLQCECI